MDMLVYLGAFVYLVVVVGVVVVGHCSITKVMNRAHVKETESDTPQQVPQPKLTEVLVPERSRYEVTAITRKGRRVHGQIVAKLVDERGEVVKIGLQLQRNNTQLTWVDPKTIRATAYA